jgi:hypothetical protein
VRWAEQVRPAWVETELPLVSERHRFAGCIDAIARCGPDLSDLWQIDFKTSKSVYPDHLLQIAAYDLLHEEVRGRRFSRLTLLHIPKDGGECKAYDWTDLSEARDMFLQLRGAAELEKAVKKMLKAKGVKVY